MYIPHLVILNQYCSVSGRMDSPLFFIMISATSFLYFIKSDALLEWFIMILILPAPKYPTAITWKNWGTSFFSSMLLVFFLTSIPFGLSLTKIGGWTWIIRH